MRVSTELFEYYDIKVIFKNSIMKVIYSSIHNPQSNTVNQLHCTIKLIIRVLFMKAAKV